MLTAASAVLLRVLQQLGSRNTRGIIINNHTLSGSETRRIVELLGKWFEFIALDELPRRLGATRRKPFCIMTFDDGRRSNATEAAPELVRLGVPAAFYLTTSFVGAGKPLWFDHYLALKNALGVVPGALSLPVLKQLPLEMLEKRLERYAQEARVELNCNSEALLPMTWDHARELHRNGFTIGAHGLEHSVLTCETWESASRSIRESMAMVGNQIGHACESFAFPNGNYSAALCQVARSSGARTVMTTEPMWVTNDAMLWRLPRIQVFPHQTAAKITTKVALALVDGVLANPDGTGRVYRKIQRMRSKAVEKGVGLPQSEP
jgi:peptidoglycan/xylan/chitin deacetylase (PgdA/CDA1 family)